MVVVVKAVNDRCLLVVYSDSGDDGGGGDW